MDTTQDSEITDGSVTTADGPDDLLAALVAADPAGAPEIAERLATALTVALDATGHSEAPQQLSVALDAGEWQT